MNSFSLYIHKYIIVLFSDNAEFSGNYSNPAKKKKKKFYLHEEEKEKDWERVRWDKNRHEEVSGLMRGSTRVIWVGNYYYKG